MKKTLIFFLALGFMFQAAVAQLNESELLEKAKTLLFDKKWSEALQPLGDIIRRFPGSRYQAQAIFYTGKCHAMLNQKQEAVQAYQEYLRRGDNSGLLEEARISLIDLAFDLLAEGQPGNLERMVDALKNSNKVVRYYAAIKLSYLKDRKAAAPAVPVLREILKNEGDPELLDRAKIALLRVDPGSLSQEKKPSATLTTRTLRIQVTSKQKGEENVDIRVPFSLADMVLKSLSDEQQASLRHQGYDADRILKELATNKNFILSFEDDESLVKIWIE